MTNTAEVRSGGTRDARPIIKGGLVLGIVAYSTPLSDLRRLIGSIGIAADQLKIPVRVLIIDNSDHISKEQLESILISSLPVDFHNSQGNIGFGRAHNFLMQKSFALGADYYIATNPDGVLHPDTLNELLREAGIPDDIILVEARQFPSEHPKIYHADLHDSPWCSGACLLINRATYQATKGFDDGFFLYCEDVDLSWRVRKLGGRCVVAPDALFFHDVADGRAGDFQRWNMALSMERLLRRWPPSVRPSGLIKHLEIMLNGIDPETRRLGSITEGVDPVDTSGTIADFNHHFGFASFRWTV